MLETQNTKLLEKNQSDVVEWKTKEREYNVIVTWNLDVIKVTQRITVTSLGSTEWNKRIVGKGITIRWKQCCSRIAINNRGYEKRPQWFAINQFYFARIV